MDKCIWVLLKTVNFDPLVNFKINLILVSTSIKKEYEINRIDNTRVYYQIERQTCEPFVSVFVCFCVCIDRPETYMYVCMYLYLYTI